MSLEEQKYLNAKYPACNGYYGQKRNQYSWEEHIEQNKAKSKEEKGIIANNEKNGNSRYNIINFAITSKMIKEFYKFDEEFKGKWNDLESNAHLIRKTPVSGGSTTWGYGPLSTFENHAPDVIFHGQPGETYLYIDSSKKDIISKAITYIKDNYSDTKDKFPLITPPAIIKEILGIEVNYDI